MFPLALSCMHGQSIEHRPSLQPTTSRRGCSISTFLDLAQRNDSSASMPFPVSAFPFLPVLPILGSHSTALQPSIQSMTSIYLMQVKVRRPLSLTRHFEFVPQIRLCPCNDPMFWHCNHTYLYLPAADRLFSSLGRVDTRVLVLQPFTSH